MLGTTAVQWEKNLCVLRYAELRVSQSSTDTHTHKQTNTHIHTSAVPLRERERYASKTPPQSSVRGDGSSMRIRRGSPLSAGLSVATAHTTARKRLINGEVCHF